MTTAVVENAICSPRTSMVWPSNSMDVLNVRAAVADQTGIDVPERHYPRTRTLRGFAAELADLAASF